MAKAKSRFVVKPAPVFAFVEDGSYPFFKTATTTESHCQRAREIFGTGHASTWHKD